jgi:hypothetical protein
LKIKRENNAYFLGFLMIHKFLSSLGKTILSVVNPDQLKRETEAEEARKAAIAYHEANIEAIAHHEAGQCRSRLLF